MLVNKHTQVLNVTRPRWYAPRYDSTWMAETSRLNKKDQSGTMDTLPSCLFWFSKVLPSAKFMPCVFLHINTRNKLIPG